MQEICNVFRVADIHGILITGKLDAQDTAKVVPDGTEGVLYTCLPPILQHKKLPANRIQRVPVSTIKLGMGFIYDVVAYKKARI